MAGSIRLLRTNFIEATATTLLNGPAIVLGVICQWTNGSNQVTRATGSFIADGVKRHSLVSGNLATKFPANMRVTALAADGLSITLTSAATAAVGGTDSGTFTPERALEEAPGYPMENIRNGKRYNGWKTSAAPPGQVIFEFDLGSAKSVAAFLMLAHEDGTIGSIPTGASVVWIDYATTYAGASPIVSWVNIGFFPIIGARDKFLDIGPINARWWRIRLDPSLDAAFATIPFGLGGLWLGAFDADMLTFGNAGSDRKRIKTRSRTEAGGKQPYYLRTGFDVYEFSPQFSPLNDADYIKLETSFTDRPVILLDHRDLPFECEWVDDEITWSPMFTGISASAPRLRSLP